MHVSWVAFWKHVEARQPIEPLKKEMATALEKISNKGIIGAARIPGSDKGFASFMTTKHEGLRKMREENELGT